MKKQEAKRMSRLSSDGVQERRGQDMQRLGVILFLTAVLAGGVVPPVAFSRGASGGNFHQTFRNDTFSEGHDLCRSVIGFFAAPDFIAREYLPALVGT